MSEYTTVNIRPDVYARLRALRRQLSTEEDRDIKMIDMIAVLMDKYDLLCALKRNTHAHGEALSR